ncbi:serine/threonine-protein phosphatase [bacterium AH-315-J23]|nr:serine/threonine-protein phosphatase [bacterium AH-315-J23]PHQ60896.1 MAG: hypothetical protein COC03_00680 [Robiginitomaculum sp.]
MLEKKLYSWLRDMPRNASFQKDVGNEPFISIQTDIGTSRSENQDRVAGIWVNSKSIADSSFVTFVVCDGMGGIEDGAGSATTALSTFLAEMLRGRRLNVKIRLNNAVCAANEAVVKNNNGGSTLAAVTFSNGRLYTVNVGDSRIYSVNNDGVKRHSKDDNLKEIVGGDDEGLLQYIGMGDGLSPHIEMIKRQHGQIFITSDGVHNLDPIVFNKIALNASSPSELANRLMNTALWTGSKDNVSIVTVSEDSLFESMKIQTDTEVTVWCPKGELQIIWPNSYQDRSPKLENQTAKLGKRNEPAPDLFDEKTKRKHKKRPNKKKTQGEGKVGFSDLEGGQ